MLKQFLNLEIFLNIVREGSFFKASNKLGISESEIMKEIKSIEEYLGCNILEKKSLINIELTDDGETLYKLALNLEIDILKIKNKEIPSSKQDMLQALNKEITFQLGVSYTIGTYIIQGKCFNALSDSIDSNINLVINLSDDIEEKIRNKSLDLGLVESPVMAEDLTYREWFNDEFIIVSNVPINENIKIEELYDFDWICRKEGSNTKKIISEVFSKLDVSCEKLNIISEVNNTVEALDKIKNCPKNTDKPVVSILSKYATIKEVENGELFEARLTGYKMTRKFYIVHSEDNKHNPYVDKIVKLSHLLRMMD